MAQSGAVVIDYFVDRMQRWQLMRAWGWGTQVSSIAGSTTPSQAVRQSVQQGMQTCPCLQYHHNCCCLLGGSGRKVRQRSMPEHSILAVRWHDVVGDRVLPIAIDHRLHTHIQSQPYP